MASPQSDTRPMRLLSPDCLRTGVKPKAGPTAFEFLNRAGTSMVARKASETTGPTPGIVINRRQTLSSRTIDNNFRCSRANWSRNARRASSSDAMISPRSDIPSVSSRMRCSKATAPITPTFSPKLRKSPRISFSIARAFSCNSLRAVSSARRFWLWSVFTCTGLNKLTRIIWAMPRASLRSLLFTCALRKAFVCRVSMQRAMAENG